MSKFLDLEGLGYYTTLVKNYVASIAPSVGGVRYGVKVNKNDSNPATRCSYMYDAVGITPAKMVYDSGNIHFDFGGWGDAFFVKTNYPCMVKFDGTEDYKLDPNDHTKKLDGTASDVANLNYDGNAMSCFSQRIYLKEWSDSNYEYYVISNIRWDETYHDYAFINKDGNHVDRIYLPMFKGYIDSNGRMRSISGTYPSNKVSASASSYTTTNDELSAAEACGDRWQLWDWSSHELVSVLLLLMSCNDNSQTAYGSGTVSGGSESATNYGFTIAGVYNDKGQFYSSTNNNATAAVGNDVKVFYIQSFWGNRWDRCLGCMQISGPLYIKWTPPYTNAKTYTNSTTASTLLSDGYINTGFTVSRWS